MDIADFFISKYNELEAERDELRNELDTLKADNREYGVFDLCDGIGMVKFNVTGSYNFTDKSYNIVKLGSARIQELIDKPQDELIRWAKVFSVGSYYGKVLEVERTRYRYTIRIVDMDGAKDYAFDPSKSTDLIEIDNPEYATGEWAPEDKLNSITDKAYDVIVDRLRDALIKAQQVEAEKEAEENSEQDD